MHVCLVIPAPGDHADHVIAAVRRTSPETEFSAVWAGDPQLRPAPPATARWIDVALDDMAGLDWNRMLVALPPAVYELARGAASIARLLESSPHQVVMVRVGAVSIVDRLDGFLASSGVIAALRCPTPLAIDGLSPNATDLAVAGRYSTAVIGFGADATEAARAIATVASAGAPESEPGALLESTLGWTGSVVERSDVAAVGWSEPGSALIALDVTDLDRGEPWRVEFGRTPPRLRLSDRPQLWELLERTRAQWAGIDRRLSTPGGVAIDPIVRELVAEAIVDWRRGEGELTPDPWSGSPAEFIEWLETPWPPWGPDLGRYWVRLRESRRDLIDAFPDPEGADREAFAEWAANSWRREQRSPLLRPTARPMRPPWYDEARDPGGINVIGYFGFDKSLGDVARRIHGCLRSADVPAVALDYHRSGSPPTRERPELTDRLCYDTNLIVVNADQMPLFDADYGAITRPGRHTIGYWFWDVEHVPQSVLDAMRLVDEIWVATPFTADALRAVASVPVRLAEIPVPEPVRSSTLPAGFEALADRSTFLVTFDHLSVTERKHPIGAIEAFKLAFPEPSDDGPMLIVKSVNASHRWAEHERVRLAAGFRPDIQVIDRHLDRPDQLALIGAAGCLVSLHRSEGLGLHLMEAMWLGTPTIATRYSGNLHFMDDDNSALVDATMVRVTRGEGYFPSEACWAEPDLGQAAEWMRRLASDRALGAALASAGHAKMLAQPTPAETGAAIARWSRTSREG